MRGNEGQGKAITKHRKEEKEKKKKKGKKRDMVCFANQRMSHKINHSINQLIQYHSGVLDRGQLAKHWR